MKKIFKYLNEQITKEIPNFKSSQNINSILFILNKLFSSNKYEIKKEGKNKVKIIIKLKDLLGNDEIHDIILYQKELDIKTKMMLMDKRIKMLEQEVEELTKENNEIKEKVDVLYKFYNDNKMLNNLKTNILNDSLIFQNKIEISFILKEIQKKIGSINNIKLIYRATRDSSEINKFHSKCDNIPNTLMIIQTKEGYKFGGFTSAGWNDNRGKNIYDAKAFCFSINLHKIYNIAKPENALHIQSGNDDGRPSFGYKSYEILLAHTFLYNKSSVGKMSDYKGESKKYEINGGNREFLVDELEVFQILFKN